MVKKTNSAPSESDYARLGKTLEAVLIKDHIQIVDNWKRFIIISFTRGLLVGFGGVIGATLLVALVVWLLSAFDGLPIVGEWLNIITSSLMSN